MTDVWCEDKYCTHNLVGKCTKEDIGLKLDPGIGLYCSTYRYPPFERMLADMDDEDYDCHGDR